MSTSDVRLLTEHLTYRPAALIDDIVNRFINILAFRATEAVERGLLAAHPSDLGFKIPPQDTPDQLEEATQIASEKAKHEIENGVHQLETLLEAKIDKNFDRLEIYALRNILNVPDDIRDWVCLDHYKNLDFNASQDTPNTQSITIQRQKLRETQKLHAWLKAESVRNKATIASLNSLISDIPPKKEPDTKTEVPYPVFQFLQNRGELTGDVCHPVKTSVAFASSQIPALKGITENLQARLKRLQLANKIEGASTAKNEEKSMKRLRTEFIEEETKRHLESVRGLELGTMGEVKDGEWQGEGRKIGAKELEDLEQIVRLIVEKDEDSTESDIKIS
ncbi:component of the MIND kinetochore complex [Blumeria graminis f. sp. tritici 96224]|uniref:Bgt-4233 n=1 Tax=Blumeria graminis f. sp. tritici 96224 TaxID=1268274 RepID=A0A061HJ71_BLUGR|nr:component of the MIND kinetochore complex [Blumeria graminis f. sp. tritici 96224]